MAKKDKRFKKAKKLAKKADKGTKKEKKKSNIELDRSEWNHLPQFLHRLDTARSRRVGLPARIL